MKKRVLHVSGRSDLGGGPEHIRQILIADSMVTHAVCCPSSGQYWETFRELLGEENVHCLDGVRTVFTFRNTVKREKIDVVHTHGRKAGLLRILLLFSGVRVLHTFHGVHYTGGRIATLETLFERVLGAGTSKSICVSGSERDAAQRWNLANSGRIQVISNGVSASKPHRNILGDRLRVVFVGRMESVKGIELLGRVVSQCYRDHELRDRVEFVVVGDGPELPVLKSLTTDIGNSMIEIVGEVPDARDFIRKGNVLISTSRKEGMPLVVLEALAEGRPVLATSVPGNTDILRGTRAGILYKYGDVKGAVRAINELLDPNVLESRSQAAKVVFVERYDSRIMTKSLDRLYLERGKSGNSRAKLIGFFLEKVSLHRSLLSDLVLTVANKTLKRVDVDITRNIDGVSRTLSSKDILSRYLAIFGVWEPALSRVLRQNLREGDVFVDVGANIGYYSALAASCVGDRGRVIAIEPNPAVLAELGQTASVYSPRINVLPEALDNSEGEVELHIPDSGNIGHASVLRDESHSSQVWVKTRRLDQVVEDEDVEIDRIKAIKVDVEGLESRVLDGASSTIERLPVGALVLTECANEDAEKEVVRQMESMHYSCFRIPNHYSSFRYRSPHRNSQDSYPVDLLFKRL